MYTAYMYGAAYIPPLCMPWGVQSPGYVYGDIYVLYIYYMRMYIGVRIYIREYIWAPRFLRIVIETDFGDLQFKGQHVHVNCWLSLYTANLGTSGLCTK